MKSFVFAAVLPLSSCGCICESLIVKVRSGGNVTLLCTNLTATPSQTDWFRVGHGSEVSCVSSKFGRFTEATPCDGFAKEKFSMSSNGTTVFLKISGVDESDSGLYFCGFYLKRHTVTGNVTRLVIEDGDKPDNKSDARIYDRKSHLSVDPLTLVLAALTLLLSAVVVVLIVKMCRPASAGQKQQRENPKDSDVDYSSVSFRQKLEQDGRSSSDRDLQPHVVYAATR